MIKRFSIKRILKYTVLLIIVFLFYLFPKKEEITLANKQITRKNNYHDIYLLDKNNYISKTSIAVSSYDNESLLKELLESLIIDGKYQARIPNGFSAVIPADTRIINIDINDEIVTINFSDTLLDVKEEYEEKILESIIYTVTSIEKYNYIKIQINGEILNKLPKSGKNINDVLSREYGVNKYYDINNINNITKVTIYYVNRTNTDDVYYIPVTKYINNDNEKIKIIIDELSSKISYESNLMSYLNYNTKLLNYSFNENEIDLNFNEYLFDSSTNKKVLEEVIYSISYSIMDNYNVSKVNFFVNNKEI